MPENPFAEVLSAQLGQMEAETESLKTLQEFCEGIQVSTAQQVLCELQRGYPSSYGQEWRPVITSVRGGPPHLLFRAYVPPVGLPVTLDLHQSGLTVANSAEELTEMLREFLREPAVVEQIRYVMRFPAPAAPAAAAGYR